MSFDLKTDEEAQMAIDNMKARITIGAMKVEVVEGSSSGKKWV